jgi:predicted RNA-binding Zn-ribbon protein involved in translation (DUF1610 family)
MFNDKKMDSNKPVKLNDEVFERIKYCPKCGSTNIFWASGLPQLWSIWQCKACGYRGSLVLTDGDLGAKLRKEWTKKHQETIK